jgi:hypothetical protein
MRDSPLDGTHPPRIRKSAVCGESDARVHLPSSCLGRLHVRAVIAMTGQMPDTDDVWKSPCVGGVGGNVKGSAFGDEGLWVRRPIAKAGGLEAATRTSAGDTKNPVVIGMQMV